MKNQDYLKEIFVNLIGLSSYPAITMLDSTTFVSNAGIMEGVVNPQLTDRLFISANFN
jgi:hypothetical protein